MLSNTAKSSASDKVNTRPRLKAYFAFISSFIQSNQERIALLLGFILVAALFYNLGRFAARNEPPEVRIEEPALDLSQIYNNLNSLGSQVAGESTEVLDCEGKIKGNISASAKIYHLPGGAFYNRTNPEACFDSEEQARAAGFRKSKR